MARIVSQCPKCGRANIKEISHKKIGKFRYSEFSCGHSVVQKLSITEDEKIQLEDGKTLWKFQVEGVHFAEKAGFNCLIADQQGLGKTIQAIAILKLHWDELRPILIVCKGSLVYRWQRFILFGLKKFAQIIDRKTAIIPDLGIWIISFDMTHKLHKDIEKLKIKTVIADEVQMIKNDDAKRTNGLRKIVRGE